MTTSFFMRRPVQRNYAAKAAYGPRARVVEKDVPLLDYTRARKENCC